MVPFSLSICKRTCALFAATTLSLNCYGESNPTDAVVLEENRYCQRHIEENHSQRNALERRAALNEEVLSYQRLVEEVLTTRAGAIELYEELRAKAQRNEPFSGHDLLQLQEGANSMLAQREVLHRIGQAHECWLDNEIPQDLEQLRDHSTGIAMSLSAALLLYDNYLSAISLYRSDLNLRRHLNNADKGFELRSGELNRIALSFASPANRYRVRRALQWFEKYGYEALINHDNEARYLAELIEQSPSRNIVRRVGTVGFIGRMAGFFATISFDTLLELKDQGVFVPSMLFGNAVGLIESRRGKLDARPDVRDRVSASLRAGDILLEKTPFRLTDTFIPGHWGHVAVWIGTPDELRELGLWDHPLVRRHHVKISAGHGVVEALRGGVKMNPLQHFLNIDDLAVLREQEMSDTQRAQVILHTLRQVGKGYDFNFDVESTDRIVCSELVYHTYSHHRWPTAKHLGRVTISPDNVAWRSLPDGFLKVAVLFHDGEEITTEKDAFMARLLKRNRAVPELLAVRTDPEPAGAVPMP